MITENPAKTLMGTKDARHSNADGFTSQVQNNDPHFNFNMQLFFIHA